MYVACTHVSDERKGENTCTIACTCISGKNGVGWVHMPWRDTHGRVLKPGLGVLRCQKGCGVSKTGLRCRKWGVRCRKRCPGVSKEMWGVENGLWDVRTDTGH